MFYNEWVLCEFFFFFIMFIFLNFHNYFLQKDSDLSEKLML